MSNGITNDTAESELSRYCVGIDLGTTNCAVAYVDSHDPEWPIRDLPLLQWVDWGQSEKRPSLPSFHYQPTEDEVAAAPLKLASDSDKPADVVGTLARDIGATRPGRRVASAKSWLCHEGVDRTAELLPWHADPDVRRLSPVEVSARYLSHIRDCWNDQFPDHPLAQQDVVITLPASFDEVARELTVEAARRAGLPRVYLIEEPQAAFYSWINRNRDAWQQQVSAGQLILVCDIGGGTSDFTLIRVRSVESADEAPVQFHRVAVGEHLILGGDNFDLALARFAESKLSEQLSPRRWEMLLAACRDAKEAMLAARPPESYTINLPTEGSRLIRGAATIELDRDEIRRVLIEGFFPDVSFDEKPTGERSGFQEFGLPYAHDPAITRHLAAFLNEHRTSGLEEGESGAVRPELVLFNGGVMQAETLRQRIVQSLVRWCSDDSADWEPTVLEHDRLDLAVARGAAYYGMVRRGVGVRIAANLGRSYYIQVSETPPQAMCLIPGKAQPGETYVADSAPLRMSIGRPVQFPLYASSTRLADHTGQLIPIQSTELTSLPPICTALSRGKRRHSETVDVCLEAELTEIGTLGLYCRDANSTARWKLQFDIRSTLETDRVAHAGAGESFGVVDEQTEAAAGHIVRDVFGPESAAEPAGVVKRLQAALEMPKKEWPPSLLRGIAEQLIQLNEGRRKSPQHEARWLNLVGYCLRPGYGVAVDDWRVGELWRRVHGGLAHRAASSRTESLILWRRVAGGLTAGQQKQLAAPLLSTLSKGGRSALAAHEQAEVWRLLGSLELLDVETKRTLGALAVRTLKDHKLVKAHDAAAWALGRLGSRSPAYGPLNCVVPAENAREWLRLIGQLDDPPASSRLAVLQLARFTGDRWRDLDAGERDSAAEWLARHGASQHYLELVRQGGSLEAEDEAAVFGESLPLGVHLVR